MHSEITGVLISEICHSHRVSYPSFLVLLCAFFLIESQLFGVLDPPLVVEGGVRVLLVADERRKRGQFSHEACHVRLFIV